VQLTGQRLVRELADGIGDPARTAALSQSSPAASSSMRLVLSSSSFSHLIA
jgi:hypothetical protein